MFRKLLQKPITSYGKTALFILLALFHFFLARTALAVIHYDYFSSLRFAQIFEAFLRGIRFDLSSIIVFFSIPLLLMNLPGKLFQNKVVQNLCSTLILLILLTGVAFLLGDIAYFDFVKRHVTFELFTMGGEDVNVLVGMIFGAFWGYLLFFILWLIPLLYIWLKITKIPFKPHPMGIKGIGKYLLFFVVLVILGRGGLGYKPITIIDAFATGNTVFSNLVLNGVFSVSHSSLRSSSVDHHFFEEKEALKILELNPENPKYPFQKTAIAKNNSKYNLVFILFEGISHKYMDALGKSDYGVTPTLDRLAENGQLFTRFYSAGQRSIEGLQVALTGIPSVIGLPTIGIGITANYSKLGEIASKNGYSTLFVQAMKRRSLRIDAVAGSAGFNEFYGKEDIPLLLDYPEPEAAKWGWDYETLMFAAEKMESIKKPFVTFILTSTTHTPYPPLPEHLEKYKHHENSEEGFLNTLHYLDWSVGKFMERLEKMPWFKNTFFIFSSDHALAHYRDGGFSDRFLIPLIIYAPQLIEPSVNRNITSQLDLFPTFIDLLNLNCTYSAVGQSVFDKKEDHFGLFREGSIAGIVTEKGFLRHSLKNRLEVGGFNGELSESYINTMEKRFLAADQLVYETIRANRWAEY